MPRFQVPYPEGMDTEQPFFAGLMAFLKLEEYQVDFVNHMPIMNCKPEKPPVKLQRR
jgi:hypothetical protein